MKTSVKKVLSLSVSGLALLGVSQFASASCTEEPFIGSVCYTAASYCPAPMYQPAAGQTLNIRNYSGLFAVIGFQYGGDKQTNFKLPDLRSRTIVGAGQGTGLPSNLALGSERGSETVTLNAGQLPAHTHNLNGVSTTANSATPLKGYLPGTTAGPNAKIYAPAGGTPVELGETASTGSSEPVSIVSPQIALTACIAVQGVYPSRPD